MCFLAIGILGRYLVRCLLGAIVYDIYLVPDNNTRMGVLVLRLPNHGILT